jgi:uncharacterized protein YutE (UPF0331/DUF86 family)
MFEKLNQLDTNIHELRKFKADNSVKDIKNDLQKQWVLRYGLFECIQITIDIACHIVSKYNLGNPNTYVECIELLNKFNYINDKLAHKIKSIAGLRNLLIHEYAEIDIKRLYNFLEHLDDFPEFAKTIKKYL